MTMKMLRRQAERFAALARPLLLICLPIRSMVEGSASYTLSIRPGTDECFYLRTPIGQPSVIRCVGQHDRHDVVAMPRSYGCRNGFPPRVCFVKRSAGSAVV